MSFWKRSLLFILLLVTSSLTFAQSDADKLKALNNYIQFSNESVHGLLIIHRLLENFNQDINKYVDLESHQINFYSNKDLPKNIFIDEENWFYEITPNEWFKVAKAESSLIDIENREKLNTSLDRMKKISYQLNQARFDIEDHINENDLTDLDMLEEVYEKLEECVAHYDNFYEEQRILIGNIDKLYKKLFTRSNVEYSDIYGRMYFIHKASESIFGDLRNKETGKIESHLTEIKKHYNSFANLKTYKSTNHALKGKKFSTTKSKIENKVSQLIDRTQFFYGDGGVPREYALYGKFYFFHNSDLINKFNRYGNGFVSDMNAVIQMLSMPVLLFSEMPHFYQVIYPEKLEKDDHIVSSDPNIERLPTKLRERNIITNTRKILVDSASLELKIFDHKIQDGDIVSLNFNGDWILEKHSIENKPMTVKLRLNEDGKNFLLLHAENLGRQPPNTLGVSYYHKGVRKEIILESDLNASEMIEIEMDGI